MTILDYNQCADNHTDALYRFILKNIKESDTAQDIVQEAFMRMWEKRQDILAEKAKSYLFTTAYRLLVDHTRYQRRFTAFDGSFDEPSEDAGSYLDIQSVLNEAVEKLPPEQKRVLLLRDYEGYSYGEIGEITGLNEPQVKVYIYRARVFMKKYIGKLEVII
ncbi:MAG: RNA polymerase sigma factor [Bacteroidales bacterium]|jgi:RNA polymerase sigma-70 factor (ECF subfamily)|nr:RNA polymerase sigma factor [Bacteroidales bacterium]